MRQQMIIAIAVLSLVLGVGVFLGLSTTWTPRDEQLAAMENSFQQELQAADEGDEVNSYQEAFEAEQLTEIAESSDGVDSNGKEDNQSATTDETNQTNEGEVESSETNSIVEDLQGTTTDKQDDETLLVAESSETENGMTDETPDEVQIFELTDPPATGDDTTSDSEAVVKDGWVQAQIDEHIDEIDENDLLVGSEIYNKLDTIYLLDLAEDGLTPEEEDEVMAYLEKELEPDEVTVAFELYAKYVHLLE